MIIDLNTMKYNIINNFYKSKEDFIKYDTNDLKLVEFKPKNYSKEKDYWEFMVTLLKRHNYNFTSQPNEIVQKITTKMFIDSIYENLAKKKHIEFETKFFIFIEAKSPHAKIGFMTLNAADFLSKGLAKYSIGVETSIQNKGYGALMVKLFLDHCFKTENWIKEIKAHVFKTNNQSLRFHRKLKDNVLIKSDYNVREEKDNKGDSNFYFSQKVKK